MLQAKGGYVSEFASANGAAPGEGKNLADEQDGELDIVYQMALRRPPS
jgi:hypothetical protein